MIYDLANFHISHAAVPQITLNSLGTAQDIQTRSGLPWLPLQLPFPLPHEAMLTEARQLREQFVPHRSAKEDHRGWYSLCLHGLSSVHTGPRDRYHTDLPYDWTDICKFCPITHNFFRDVFGYQSYARVRFMLVEAGGYILPHRDSTTDELTAINIALNNPEHCDFVMENAGTVPLQAGRAVLLSLSRQHIVWNRSIEDRYHIIVHGQRDTTIWDDIILNSARVYCEH
jgi:hypothetical protein